MAGQFRSVGRFERSGEWVRPGLAVQIAAGRERALSDYQLDRLVRDGLIRARLDANGVRWYHEDDCLRVGAVNKEHDDAVLRIRLEAQTAVQKAHYEATGVWLALDPNAETVRRLERGEAR